MRDYVVDPLARNPGSSPTALVHCTGSNVKDGGERALPPATLASPSGQHEHHDSDNNHGAHVPEAVKPHTYVVAISFAAPVEGPYTLPHGL